MNINSVLNFANIEKIFEIKTDNAYIKALNKLVSPYASKKFTTETWTPVYNLIDIFKNHFEHFNFRSGNGEYIDDKHKVFKFKFCDSRAYDYRKPRKMIRCTIIACACGIVEDPWRTYDLIIDFQFYRPGDYLSYE